MEKEYIAEMLLKLVKHHKRTCEDPECGISTFIIYENFYKPFLGEEKANEHLTDFI